MKPLLAILLLGLMNACGTIQDQTTSTVERSSEVKSDLDEAIARAEGNQQVRANGDWKMSVTTPRGVRANTLTIYTDNGVLKGKTDKETFTIEQDGNKLTWTSSIDSPMGSLDASHEVYINGDKMSGKVRASGRSLDISGKKM